MMEYPFCIGGDGTGFDNVLSGIAGAVSAGGKYASIAKKLESPYQKQAKRIIDEIEETKDLFE